MTGAISVAAGCARVTYLHGIVWTFLPPDGSNWDVEAVTVVRPHPGPLTVCILRTVYMRRRTAAAMS